MADADAQEVDARAKDRRNDDHRERETIGLDEKTKAARKAEADALIRERDGYMKRGMTARLEEVDEALRALGYREEQSTNANVQREFARQLPDSEKRDSVAAGKVPADVLDATATKGKGSK